MSEIKEEKKEEIIQNVEESTKENKQKQKKKNTKEKVENTSYIEQQEEKIEPAIKVKQEETQVGEAIEQQLEQIQEETETEENAPKEERIEEQSAEGKKKDWLHHYSILIVIVSIVLLIGLGIFSTIFGLQNRKSDTIVSGISIKGIDISGLTKQQATEKIMTQYEEKLKQNIVLKHHDYETSIIPEQIEAKFQVAEAIEMAYEIGRSGKLLKDNYAIINANLNKIDIKPGFSYNEEGLTKFVEGISENLPDTVKQSGYYIDNNNLIVNKGKAGVVVQENELKQKIVDHIVELKTEQEIIQMPVITKEPDKIDLQKIHDEIYKEPKDAYYVKDPFTVYPQVNGVDFKISIEEAKQALENSEEEITIPLKITIPNITTNQIGTEAFPNLLATYTTSFATSNRNRTTNIKLSSNKINGVVVMPGETFSYNAVVGKRTAAAGYKEAAIYVNGKVDSGIGGGICQVSSTLYNTVLRANLEIVKRYNHRFATGYVPLSTDATVSWGGPDFVFKNSRKHPIKVVSTVTGGKIRVDIYGCKEEVEYDIQIKSETLQTIPTKVTYRTNTNLPKGTQKTVQKGHGGYKSRAYRIVSLDGKVISKQLLSTDTYAQLETMIEKN